MGLGGRWRCPGPHGHRGRWKCPGSRGLWDQAEVSWARWTVGAGGGVLGPVEVGP